ncbi:MAG: TIGR00300 family protein, partial [Thermoproteota archaeon]|nr:TIGR00300 family protein [Thermoproteota archaeon]
MNKYSKIIEVKGHLIDSLVLTKIFDSVMDLDGKFEVMKISVGKLKTDESYAKLRIIGKNNTHLSEIMTALHREGATTKAQKKCKTKSASKNMVFPDNFYSTTNNHTAIYHNNKWINVDNMMMDKCIVVKGNTAKCVPIREVKKGDKVVVGEEGIKVSTPERPREGMNVFQFMGSGSSSERPTQHIARKVAEDIMNTKKNKGKIVLVG